MKLARKLVLAFIGAIFTLLALYGYLRVRRESALFETDMMRDAHTMGRTLGAAVADVWRAEGQRRALSLVEDANDPAGTLHIHWIWIDAPPGDAHRAQAAPERLEPLKHGEETVVIDETNDGLMMTYIPVAVPNPRLGGLEIAESLAPRTAYVRGTIVSTVIATMMLSLVCGLIALWVGVGFVGRPIHALIEQSRRIGVGDFSRRLALEQRDEVGELATEMNAMCDRLEQANQRIATEAAAKLAAEEQLRHAERLTTVGKLASGIAHELGTPLNVVSVRARMIAVGEAKGESIADNARIIVEQADRMTKIIRQLLDFARRRSAQKAKRDLQPVASQTIALLEPIAQKNGVTISLDVEEPRALVEVDEGQVQQALTNLVINAIHAMPKGGELAVSIATEERGRPDDPDAPSSEYVRVTVRDQGGGIDEAVLAHIFEPFFTTKGIGEGTGLGLSVTYGIVQEHGGFIDVQSEAGKGSTFALYFPKERRIVSGKILIVDDDRSMCELLEESLGRRGFKVSWKNSADEALEAIKVEDFDVVVTDLNMRGMNGIELCQRIASNRPDVPVIVITAFGNMDTAIAAIRAGAYDFITKPFEVDALKLALERAVTHRSLREEVKRLRRVVADSRHFENILGASPAMKAVYDLLDRVGESDASVLITGESGTGKELVARALHKRGKRKEGPFVAINCSAMPETLLESELFGHAKGAFTDARQARAGLFVQSSGGTLFLDEIGDMPLGLQPKLLRALQERTARPVGGSTEVPFDVRIVAATNRDLESAVEERTFREDLYYRINVIHVALPPLRARGSDVLMLAQHFAAHFASLSGKQVVGVSPEAAEKLLAYSWPGNVRELQNSIERAVALARYDKIVVEDLPEKVASYRSSHVLIASNDPSELVPMEEVERRYILRVLEAVGGNKTLASQVLGLDRKTLYRKLERYMGGKDAPRDSKV